MTSLAHVVALGALGALPFACGGAIIESPEGPPDAATETTPAPPRKPDGRADAAVPDGGATPREASAGAVDATMERPPRDTGVDVTIDAMPRDASVDRADAARDTGADARDAAPDVCAPINVCGPGEVCGTVVGNCGQMIACGICAGGATCGEDHACHCPPASCPAGANCGTITNACGGAVSCGTCAAPETCGGGGVPQVCGVDRGCDGDTVSCLRSKDRAPGSCYQCGADLGCFDPAFSAHRCEDVQTPAPADCQALLGTPLVPTEAQVCLATLKGFFSTHCAAGMQINPCLCGTTAPDRCLSGTEAPTGPLYPLYQCDLGPSIGQVNNNILSPTMGAGIANAILQCLQAFSCDCQY